MSEIRAVWSETISIGDITLDILTLSPTHSDSYGDKIRDEPIGYITLTDKGETIDVI